MNCYVTIFNSDNSFVSFSELGTSYGRERTEHSVKSLEGTVIRKCDTNFIMLTQQCYFTEKQGYGSFQSETKRYTNL